MESTSILEIKNLYTYIKTEGERRPIVKNVSLDLKAGEIHGIVGESGSGKTFTAKSILRLHDESSIKYEGEINYGGVNLLGLTEAQVAKYRERDIAYIFQNPSGSFDNLFTVGDQIEETLRYVAGLSKLEAKKKTFELLESVGVTPAKKRVLQLFKKLRDERNLSVLCITHDLGVVAEICDTVSVMYDGRIVETGDVRTIFNSPRHEYTKQLLRSFKEVS